MKLRVNDLAYLHSSFGARRYAQGVLDALAWPSVGITDWARFGRAARLGELIARGNPNELLWSPAHRGPLRAHRHVVTVLDCINVEHVYRGDWRLKAYVALIKRVLHNASAVVAISRSTADAIERVYGLDRARIDVLAGPTRLVLDSLDVQDRLVAKDSPKNEPPYALMLVNALVHKNTTRAIEGIVSSRAWTRGDLQLRIVGSVEATAQPLLATHAQRITLQSGLDTATLHTWLQSAAMLISPSLDEGLNLPIAEALAVKTMVACSDIPVHREFYDGSVVWFDPLQPGSIAHAVDACITSPWPMTQRGLPASAVGFGEIADGYRRVFERVINADPSR